MEFTVDEIKHLKQFYTVDGADIAGAIHGTLERWKRVVIEIKNGYDDEVYEYINDLFYRDTLEEIFRGAPQGVIDKVRPLLDAIDKEFLESTTTTTSKSLLPSAEDRTSLNLWHRIPSSPSKTLKDSLKSEGF